jgi:3-phytase
MCIWLHPTDASLSTIIASDKSSGYVYVYDLSSNVLQSFHTGQPGNIDVRYGFPLGGECVDLVAFNERSENTIRVYRVNSATRLLERVDDGTIATGANYGFTLYRHQDGTLYGFTGDGTIRRYRLFDSGLGTIKGMQTAWSFTASTIEGMVGDDDTGWVYFGEESAGLWRLDPMNAANATRIAAVGDASGLQADVEGVTIYYGAGATGYILASSQGASQFTVFRREVPHTPVGNFSLAQVGQTDGIDVCNLALGFSFPLGVFLCHNGSNCCPVVAARWEHVAAALGGALIDTGSWDPRRDCGVSAPQSPMPSAALLSASPNPFNPRTTIHFRTLEASRVHLGIYDAGGRLLRVLADADMEPGEHHRELDAEDDAGRPLVSGIYFVRFAAGRSVQSIKLVLSK